MRGAPLHLPGDGVQEMRFAEPDRRVNVERIEAGNVAQCRLGDLGGAGMRHAVGGADDEAVEGIARIEGRALEAADARPSRSLRGDQDGAAIAAIGGVRSCARAVDFAHLTRCGLLVALRGAGARLAQNDVDLLRTLELGAAAGKEIVGVVRLNPGSEEFHRHRDPDGLGVEALELEGVEPAREDIVAEAGAQHGACLLATAAVARPVGAAASTGALHCASVPAGRNCTFRLLNRLHCVTPATLSTCTSKSSGQISTVALRRRGCASDPCSVFRNGCSNLAPTPGRRLSSRRPALDGDWHREAPRNHPPRSCIADIRHSSWLPLPCDFGHPIGR